MLTAQLRLLSFGMLVEAKFVDDIKESVVQDIDIDTDAEALASSLEEKIDAHVHKSLTARGIDPSVPTPRAYARYAQVNEYRDGLIREFFAGCASMKTCPLCRGVARTIIQENMTKIIAMPLLKKHRDAMISKGLSESVLLRDAGMASVVNENGQTKVEDPEGDSDKSDGSDAVVETQELGFGRRLIDPTEVKERLEKLWQTDSALASNLFATLGAPNTTHQSARAPNGAAMLFLNILPVSPPRYRPASVMGDKTFENPMSNKLVGILKACSALKDMNARLSDAVESGETDRIELYQRRFHEAWQRMQLSVNVLVDAGADKSEQEPVGGIKQVLEKKEGLFRMHMMGKRVNYACRSVISPDPNIGTHEVGIPMVFALKLTYPEPVTSFNVEVLRRAVIAGPDVHPGATHVMDHFGNLTVLSRDREKRLAIAAALLAPPPESTTRKVKHPNKKVFRMIVNGDFVLLNRQPTLHKASLMAHQARILEGERTLRLHYANCKTFNADFDGDEMNVHFPQNELARAEARGIALAHRQYISLGGVPLRGLIQDHVVSGVRMICRDAFYDRGTFQQMLYTAVGELEDGAIIQTVPPAITRPVQLWTGKQLITSMMANLTRGKEGLNYIGKTQTQNSWSAHTEGPLDISEAPVSMFGSGVLLEGESAVIFRGGTLINGVLDKKQIGSAEGGFVHACQEIYGDETAGNLLTMLGRIFTIMVKYNAHTFGIEDVLLTSDGNAAREKLIGAASKTGPEEARKYTNTVSSDPLVLRRNIETIFRDPTGKQMAGLDGVMMSACNVHQSAIIKATCPSGLLKPFPANHLQVMIQTGAKGSSVNGTQISSCLGQQALEGKRVPVMVSGKTLPSFPPFDPSARAGGMILGRFLTGIAPQEYYFHCMAGREGLVDTAVKTSRSGYLQRCLVKHMEDLKVGYDLSVRDSDGSLVQFLYGEDGLDVSKTTQLKNYELMSGNYKALLERYAASNLPALFPGKYGEKGIKRNRKGLKRPEKYGPCLAELRPDRYFGSVSEAMELSIRQASMEIGALGKLTADRMEQLMYLKNFRSLAEPGEAVGVLAAQAVGEPSTQMTLNTFHFAGRSDMNVTLGIPRLREILMTASPTIKTPIMYAKLATDSNKSSSTDIASQRKLAGRLRRVTLANVLQKVGVTQSLTPPEVGGARTRIYEIELTFISEIDCQKEFSITQAQVMAEVEHWLGYKLVGQIVKRQLLKSTSGFNSKQQESETGAEAAVEANARVVRTAYGSSDEESDSNDEEVANDDSGSLMTKAKSSRSQTGTYDVRERSEIKDTLPPNTLDASDYDATLQPSDQSSGDEDSDSISSGPEDENKSTEIESESKTKDSKGGTSKKPTARVAAVMAASTNILSYTYNDKVGVCRLTVGYPASAEEVLFVALIEREACETVIRAVPGINRCELVKTASQLEHPDLFQVEGQNLSHLWNYPKQIEVNSIRTNDIAAMLRTYGVEAARASIVAQVNEVFAVYGIRINPRHMALIADKMTHEGGYRGMNRMGIRGNASSLLKMSFETTFEFLRESALCGDFDACTSASAQLVVGQPCHTGTGSFSLSSRLPSMN